MRSQTADKSGSRASLACAPKIPVPQSARAAADLMNLTAGRKDPPAHFICNRFIIVCFVFLNQRRQKRQRRMCDLEMTGWFREESGTCGPFNAVEAANLMKLAHGGAI